MKKFDETKIEHLLNRGVENIYPNRVFLEKLLKSGKKLTIYQGIDPTGPNIHIGHAIPFRKLAEFQKLGHKIIVLIGDFTAKIGDPTDKLATRIQLTDKQVKANMKNYIKQLSLIIDFKGKNPAEIKYNSKWLAKLSFADLIMLSSNFTAQQTLARDMFKKRIEEEKDLYLHEFLYPMMQAYDSVAMNVDGEVGGNDQMFNMLAGRTLMKKMLNKEKFVITTKLLVDISGKKMGKTEGNIIALDETPEEMFGKVMNWTDGMIIPGFELLTDLSDSEIKIFSDALKKGENPRNLKFKLAEEIVKVFCGLGEALKAGEAFNKQFRDREKPQDIPEMKVKGKIHGIVELLFDLGLAGSKSEARRLVEQGGVKIDDAKITDVTASITVYTGMLVQVGKRKFAKIKSV
ncbi:MAG TPA: tyrosine--tRNA ligase [Patescibacteria group bacterium]|nr:tyrosine--tRNA ligase [Patescibacteria group bacterium]